MWDPAKTVTLNISPNGSDERDGAEGESSQMETKAFGVNRRQFLSGVSLSAIAAIPSRALPSESAQGDAPWKGAILRAQDGLHIPLAGGRELAIKVDSQVTPGVRMSMVTEDLPPGAGIQVHLHQREDEIIFIRMGHGIATLGDREVAVGPGATVYVPQGVWHGLRNTGESVLVMSAVYSPPGFEQAFKDSLRPNRTQAEIEANRKKHGIVYRDG
jgi:mannose-6-phosphate isomerase-like protein (cupin superfamily)